MQNGGRISGAEAEVLGRVINFIETAATDLRRQSGNVMTAMEVVTLLTNRIRSGQPIPRTDGYQHDPDNEAVPSGIATQQAA